MNQIRNALIPLALCIVAGTAHAQPLWFKADSVPTVPPYTGTMVPSSINDLGQVVGTVPSAVGGSRGYIWLPTPAYGYPAGTTLLSVPAGHDSEATGINNAGQVSGGDSTPNVANVNRWNLATSPTPVVLHSLGRAWCINSAGVVGGYGVPTTFPCAIAGLFSAPGVQTGISGSACANSYVTSMNAAGLVTGLGLDGNGMGFYAAPPGYKAKLLPNYPGVGFGGAYTSAYAVNDSGQIVGQVYHLTRGAVAILFQDLNLNGAADPATEYTILSTPASGTCAALAVNNAGVAGGYRASDGHGMLWSSGLERDLNRCIAKDSLGYPAIGPVVDINESGQILCRAATAWGEDRAVVLTPMCYLNCDLSMAPPVLNANDFQCFMNRFAAGEPYANCDESTAAPVLNANDFQCFINRFAVGCP